MTIRMNYLHSIPINLIVSTVLSLAGMMMSCVGHNKENELADLDRKARQSMSTYEKKGLDSIGNLLLDKSRASGYRNYEAKAHLYLSSYRTDLPEKEIMRRRLHLDEAERIASELENDTILCHVYNLRGVWEMHHNLNFSVAQYYFSKSLEKASLLEDRRFSIPAELNMSEVCRVTGDTLGLHYDRELFDYAVAIGEPHILLTAGLHCATYYAATASDTTELRPYIEAVKSQKSGFEGVPSMIYARYYFHKGDYAMAEEFVRHLDTTEITDYKILHANILHHLGRYEESERILRDAAYDLNVLNHNDRDTLFHLRTANMAAAGDWRQAFSRQKEYEAYRDSMDKVSEDNIIRRYRIEYESFAKDRQIKEQQSRLFSMGITISAIVIVMALIITGYTLYIKRRNRLFKEIVQQNLDFMKRNEDMENRLVARDARIEELEGLHAKMSRETTETTETTRGVDENFSARQRLVSDEKADEIYERIRELMEKRKIWKDLSVTRDGFAEMAGCNRTYLAEILKTKTGMGYTRFMNTYRVREAMAILSDPEDTTPLNNLFESLGFLTIGTFYKVFKQQTGMSPAVFRKTARELQKDQGES